MKLTKAQIIKIYQERKELFEDQITAAILNKYDDFNKITEWQKAVDDCDMIIAGNFKIMKNGKIVITS